MASKPVTITPSAAALAGCKATCTSYVEDGVQEIPYTDTDEKGYQHFTNYSLWAKGTRRWRFTRFTFDWENTDLNKDGTTSSQQSSTSSSRNPYPSSLSITQATRPSEYYSNIPANHSQGMHAGSFSNVIAEFEYVESDPTDQYYIETVASPAGGGVTLGDGWFYAGDTCRLFAAPNPGYEFSHWSNGSTDPEISFSVVSSATYTAYFVESSDSSEEWGEGHLIYSDTQSGLLVFDDATGRLVYDDRPVPELH